MSRRIHRKAAIKKDWQVTFQKLGHDTLPTTLLDEIDCLSEADKVAPDYSQDPGIIAALYLGNRNRYCDEHKTAVDFSHTYQAGCSIVEARNVNWMTKRKNQVKAHNKQALFHVWQNSEMTDKQVIRRAALMMIAWTWPFADIEIRRAWLGPNLQEHTRIRHLIVSKAWNGHLQKLCLGNSSTVSRLMNYLQRESVQAEVAIPEAAPQLPVNNI